MKKVILCSLMLVLLFSNLANAKTLEKEDNQDVLLESLGYNLSEKNLFASSRTVDNKNGLFINGEELKRYAELGYSLEQVKDFELNDIEYLFGIEGELLAVDQTYIRELSSGEVQRITKNEYEVEVNEHLRLVSICNTSSSTCSDSELSPNWIKLTTSIARIANTSPQEYIIVHNFSWTKKPFYTYKDAVGVAHPASMTPIQNSEYLKYSSDEYKSTNIIVGVGPWTFAGTKDSWYYSANDKTGGMAFEFSLHQDGATVPQIGTPTSYKYENHRGTLAYRSVRSNSSYTSGSISGHYIHTETSFAGSLGVSVDGVGMSISANVTKTPAIETGVSFNY